MMQLLLSSITILILVHNCWTQFSAETYPDPRFDPITCKISTVGPVCDPSELLTFSEKEVLASRIKKLLTFASSVPNTSPSCQLFPGKRLDIIIAVIDKIGAPNIPVDIEKFANNLKMRYQLYQNMNLCDLMVLIVNSNRDRQVFTVAGKDTKLTRDALKTAFEQNIHHFRTNNYAVGLQGMVEFIANSYREAQLGSPLFAVPSVPIPPRDGMIPATSEAIDNLVTSFPQPASAFHSRRSEHDGADSIADGNLTASIEDPSDQLWIDILTQAMSRCGNNRDKMGKYVQAVVEEAMSLSLRLISDRRYLTIEERMQTMQNDPETRSLIWSEAKAAFIDHIYYKYLPTLRNKAILRCPVVLKTARTFSSIH